MLKRLVFFLHTNVLNDKVASNTSSQLSPIKSASLSLCCIVFVNPSNECDKGGYSHCQALGEKAIEMQRGRVKT